MNNKLKKVQEFPMTIKEQVVWLLGNLYNKDKYYSVKEIQEGLGHFSYIGRSLSKMVGYKVLLCRDRPYNKNRCRCLEYNLSYLGCMIYTELLRRKNNFLDLLNNVKNGHKVDFVKEFKCGERKFFDLPGNVLTSTENFVLQMIDEEKRTENKIADLMENPESNKDKKSLLEDDKITRTEQDIPEIISIDTISMSNVNKNLFNNLQKVKDFCQVSLPIYNSDEEQENSLDYLYNELKRKQEMVNFLKKEVDVIEKNIKIIEMTNELNNLEKEIQMAKQEKKELLEKMELCSGIKKNSKTEVPLKIGGKFKK